ncbi:MAG: hypothetical protein ACLS4Z_00940 [Christensenellaceae bacterium]
MMGIFYEKAFPVAKTALKRASFEGFTEAGTEIKGFLRASADKIANFREEGCRREWDFRNI